MKKKISTYFIKIFSILYVKVPRVVKVSLLHSDIYEKRRLSTWVQYDKYHMRKMKQQYGKST